MRLTIAVAPPNSIVSVMDRTVAVIPASFGSGLTAATPTCIVVKTLAQIDGETSISISDEPMPSGTGLRMYSDGVLYTPSRVMSVRSVLDEILLEVVVQSEETLVQIWANHPSEPEEIAICYSRGVGH